MAFDTKNHPYLDAILHTCKPFKYDPKLFPNVEGVYLITLHLGVTQVFYIGEAQDVCERFSRHHRRHELNLLQEVGVPISVTVLPTPWLSAAERYDLEQHLKKELQPLRNDRPWLEPHRNTLKSIRLPKDLKDLLLD